jgi:hypothetical protein
MYIWLVVTLIVNGQQVNGYTLQRPDLRSCLNDAATLLYNGPKLDDVPDKEGRTLTYEFSAGCRISNTVSDL